MTPCFSVWKRQHFFPSKSSHPKEKEHTPLLGFWWLTLKVHYTKCKCFLFIWVIYSYKYILKVRVPSTPLNLIRRGMFLFWKLTGYSILSSHRTSVPERDALCQLAASLLAQFRGSRATSLECIAPESPVSPQQACQWCKSTGFKGTLKRGNNKVTPK